MSECIGSPPTRRGNPIVLDKGQASQEMHRWLELVRTCINNLNAAEGTPGPPGQNGSKIFVGSNAPSDSLGANSDIYIDQLSGDFYQKEGDTWAFQFTLGLIGYEAITEEPLNAGDIINHYDDGLVTRVRKADATDIQKPATGYVLLSYAINAGAIFYNVRRLPTPNGDTLTSGQKVWLSETPGEVTITPVTTSGSWLQPIGWSHEGGLIWEPKIRVQRA